MIRFTVFISLLVAAAAPLRAGPVLDYATHCAVCHGADRLGGTGPALIPEALNRLRGADLAAVIAQGRAATQMPGFANILDEEAIMALAAWLESPLEAELDWGEAEITASLETNAGYVRPDAPVFSGDPLNLFVVVETGDSHLSVLDGDSFEWLARLPTPYAVHGGPKFTPDGRHVFVMSRDGWVQKIDLWALEEVARVRAGINSRNIALSKDGRWLAVANYLPTTLTILSTEDLSVARLLDVTDAGGTPSRVSAVYQAAPRASFVLALKDVPEIWEIATDSEAPIFTSLVHGDEQGRDGAVRTEELFVRRRIKLRAPIEDFFFTMDYAHLIGASRDGERGVVVDLIQGREIAELPLGGMPHLGSGISWERHGRRVLATPHLREPMLSVIDTGSWQVVQEIVMEGPGFFLRSHETSPYLWADVFFGPNRDVIHVIDKESLEIVRTLRPVPGATVAHVEFDRHGRHALVSVWEDDGAILVYDAASLEEVRRIPMRKPSGKYNVWNKITFSEGTSH